MIAAMGARILFRDAQGRTGEVMLSPDAPVYVGRALDCAVRTDDAMVSRKHSIVRCEQGGYVVEDLGSSNGTHVNDVRVTRRGLAHNDVVRCGNLWLRYIEDTPIESASTAPNGIGAADPQAATGPDDGNAGGRWKSTLNPFGGTDDTVDAGQAIHTPPVAPVAVRAGRMGKPAPVTAPGPATPVPAPARLPSPVVDAISGRAAVVPMSLPPPAQVLRPAGPVLAAVPAVVSGAAAAASSPSPAPARTTDETLSARELERRLRIATSRASEIERSLRTLLAELDVAQEKIRALMAAVRELGELEP
jgi:predicted component of type VI protein secretion system